MVFRSIAHYSAWIEKIAERVSEDVHAKNDQSYREARGRDHPDVLEHAVGKSFRPWYDKEVDPLFRRVLAAAKTELDPKWMLNPGLIVDKPAGLKIVG